MTEILVLEKPEEKLRRERERLLGELSVYGERLAFLQDTVDEIKEMIECYDEAIENLGTDHAKQNAKTLEEELVYMGEAFVGSKKIETAGQYLDEVYRYHDDLLKRLRSEGYEYLARDEVLTLWAYKSMPEKSDKYWGRGGGCEVIEDDHFPEVQWTDNEPTKISELLASYENDGENGK